MSQNRRWAIYLRVSTQDQATGLDAQSRTMVEFVERQGIKNYEIYSDHGISGAKISRPALDRLMKDVDEGGISHVCVYSFSRFARSVTHLLQGLEAMKSANCRISSHCTTRFPHSVPPREELEPVVTVCNFHWYTMGCQVGFA